MLLEQIMRNQERLREQKKDNVVKIGIVPSSEITPEKGLRAQDHLKTGTGTKKTLALKLDLHMHTRLQAMSDRLNLNSKRAVAAKALEYGMQMLEDRAARNK